MLKEFLPDEIYNAIIKKHSINEVNEIRIRAKKPITILCNTKTYFLGKDGACNTPNLAIYGSGELIEEILYKASNYSVYAVNEQIKKGYITINGGIRIGISGEVVCESEIKTIKNFNSICIRIPHFIKNASLPIFNHVLNDGKLNNTLIISPPGAGKTTMLRDLIFQFSNHNYPYNVFIADERGEVTGGENSNINLGYFYDSVSFLNKKDSILLGIRSMSPNIIATDELGDKDDFDAVEYAINCGVCVIATMHAEDIDDLKNKPEFKRFIENKYFKRYIVLSKQNGVGTIQGVYKENLTKVYGGILWLE